MMGSGCMRSEWLEHMKKKSWYLIYIIVVLALVLIPFAGMSVAATDETTENK